MSKRHESYESTLDQELSVKALALCTVGLVALIVGSGVLMWVLSEGLRSMSAAGDPPPPAMEEAREAYTPPSPRLQSHPTHAMDELRALENETMESYGWIDEQAGIAHIPIERALELYAAGQLSPKADSEDVAPAELPATGTDG